jgi:hypothetical protein
MKKILVALCFITFFTATFIIAEDIGDNPEIHTYGDCFEMKTLFLPPEANDIWNKCVDAPMVLDEVDFALLVYLDGYIKHLGVREGEIVTLKTYKTDYAPDGIYEEVTDNDGYKYIACFAHNGRDNDMGTIKYNPDGEMEWVQIFDSGGKDVSARIGVDRDGNVYNVGYSYIEGLGGIRTVKYNSQGQIVWVKIYNPGEPALAESISFDDEGNVLVECCLKEQGLKVITYDTDGNQL